MQPETDPPRSQQDWLEPGLRHAFGGADGRAQLPASDDEPHIDSATQPRCLQPGEVASADPPLTLPPDARYQLLGEAGRGGLGIVYRGHDRDLGREVALKVLDQRLAADAGFVRRFVAEARLCGRLQHPGVVPVHELGLDSAERPFFVMRLIHGRTFAELLADGRGRDDQRARCLEVFARVCQTMAYAHEHGVIHRDLKPGNVMIGAFGEVQVVDWGLAKVLASSGAEPAAALAGPGDGSASGTAVGTPSYMPPEQARGEVERLDRASDVFALGAVLCEILTGAPPYPAGDGDPLARARAADLGPAHARLRRSRADAALIALACQCLQEDPMQRPASAAEVAAAVERFQATLAERARRAEVHAAEARVRARWTVAVAATVVLGALLGGSVWLAWERDVNARTRMAEHAVRIAMDEALTLRVQAEAAGDDLGAWRRAVAMAENARAVASAQRVGNALTAEARMRLEAVRARADEKQRIAALQTGLLELGIPPDADALDTRTIDANQGRAARVVPALLRGFGVDVLAIPPAAAAAALRCEIEVEIGVALDHWYVALGDSESDRARAVHLAAVLDLLDHDPWRAAFRQASRRRPPVVGDLLALAASVVPAEQPASILKLLCEGLWVAGRQADALAWNRRFRDAHPQSFELVFRLGLGLEIAAPSDPREAASCYRVAHALRPDLREVLHRLGIALEKAGDQEGAQGAFERLVALEPQRGHWHGHLAGILAQRHQRTHDATLLDQALAAAERGTQLEPTQAQLRFLARVQQERGEYDGAVASLQQALTLAPDGEAIHYDLAMALHKHGDRAAAIAALRQAIAIQPRYFSAYLNLGALLHLQGELEEAATCFREAMALRPDLAVPHRNLGVVLDSQGDADGALQEYRRAVAVEPRSASAHRQLGTALRDRGQLAEARQSLDVALLLEPSDAEALLVRAGVLHALGEEFAAVETLRQVLPIRPQERAGRRLMVDLCVRLEEFEDAIATIDELVALGEPEAAMADVLAFACLRACRYERAIAAAEAAIVRDPSAAPAYALRAQAQHALGDFDAAEASLREALRVAPDDPQLPLELWQLLYDVGKIDPARVQLARMRERFVGQDDKQAMLQQAEWLLANVEYFAAVAAGTATARSATEWQAAAETAQGRHRFLEAAETWKRAFAACPELAESDGDRRFSAARAALRCQADTSLPAAAREKWRQEALAWLELDLAFHLEELHQPGDRGIAAQRFLRRWRRDRDLSDVRDAAAIATYPTDEAQRWRALWAVVDTACTQGRDMRALQPSGSPAGR